MMMMMMIIIIIKGGLSFINCLDYVSFIPN